MNDKRETMQDEGDRVMSSYYGATEETTPLHLKTCDSIEVDVSLIDMSEDYQSGGNRGNNDTGKHQSNGRQASNVGGNATHSRLNVPFNNLLRTSDEMSNDVGSVCTASYSDTHKYDPKRSIWLSHPQVRSHWQVFLAAFCLLTVGTVLLVLGVVVIILPDTGFQSYVFFIAGTMCFIPGAYHVVFVYCAIKGRKGYDFYKLPLFN